MDRWGDSQRDRDALDAWITREDVSECPDCGRTDLCDTCDALEEATWD